MTTAAMHRARSILTAARTKIAQIADQDDAIPWTLLDVDRVITDLTNRIEAEEAHPDAPVFVDFPMQEMSRA
jgi:hypothetical protein